jgi:hypothetical protein
MSEWFNSNKQQRSNLRKLLQERIEKANSRRNLTAEETKRLVKLEAIAEKLQRGENVQNRQLQTWLSAEEYEQLEYDLTVGDVIDGEGNVTDTVILKKHQTKGNKCNSVYFSDFVREELSNYLSKYSHLKEHVTERLIQSQKGAGFSSMTLQHLFKNLY